MKTLDLNTHNLEKKIIKKYVIRAEHIQKVLLAFLSNI